MGTSARPKIRFFKPEDCLKASKSRSKAILPSPKPQVRYGLSNWPSYNQALIQRGSLSLWLDEQTLQTWYYTGPQQPGGVRLYSDACIECALRIKYVLGLAFRQTQGLLASLIRALRLDLQTPSYSQLCRRQAQLAQGLIAEQNQTAARSPSEQQAAYVVVDSTGLKVYGEGEWKIRQHGTSQRRTWRKVHLACDEATNQILAIALTTNDIDDASMLKPLLDELTQPVSRVAADGAYDQAKVYDYLQQRQIQPVIPPRANAIVWTDKQGQFLEHARNQAVLAVEELGMATWKKLVGYHRRSKAETSMFRLKITFGERLRSRRLISQKVEVRIKAVCLNRFCELGRPITIKKTPN